MGRFPEHWRGRFTWGQVAASRPGSLHDSGDLTIVVVALPSLFPQSPVSKGVSRDVCRRWSFVDGQDFRGSRTCERLAGTSREWPSSLSRPPYLTAQTSASPPHRAADDRTNAVLARLFRKRRVLHRTQQNLRDLAEEVRLWAEPTGLGVERLIRTVALAPRGLQVHVPKRPLKAFSWPCFPVGGAPTPSTLGRCATPGSPCAAESEAFDEA